jgi:uncharacterized membrane protein YedE/YeeE
VIAILSSLVIGSIFGAGLAISQMMNPAKVVAFLDVAGDWDPTLGLVMIGALIASIPGFLLVRQRQAPILGGRFQIPTRRDSDIRLVAGAAIFGVGWGLAGFCPGPALAALSTGLWQVAVFVAAMVAGMVLFRALPTR